MPSNPLRNFPSVTELLDHPQLRAVRKKVTHHVAVAKVRSYLEDLRMQIQTAATDIVLPTVSEVAQRIAQRILQGESPGLMPVINATGILLHAGLGRAPLAQSAIEDITVLARDYVNLEIGIEKGGALPRAWSVERLLAELTAAEAALVLSSGSAAVMLTLGALACERDVLVSRGQLGETADGSRLADLIRAAGAKPHEVGAANSTRLDDYRQGMTPEVAVLLVAHPIDYAIAGRTGEVNLSELVQIGRQHGPHVIHDLGAGGLVDGSPFGFGDEPFAAQSIRAGADLVIARGDMLLGGPQCGIIVGKRSLVEVIARHPLLRALEADKITLAALAATLRLYREPETARQEVPLLQLSTTSVENLHNRGQRLAPQLAACPCIAAAELVEDVSYLAASPVPSRQLPAWSIALEPGEGFGVESLATALGTGRPAVVARMQEGRLLLNLRTVFPRQDQQLVEAVSGIKGKSASA